MLANNTQPEPQVPPQPQTQQQPPPQPQAQPVFCLARLAGQIMLESGGEIYRVEDTVQRICESVLFEQVDVMAIPTGIFISLETPDRQITTTVKRVQNRTIDLSRVSQVNQISRDIAGGRLTIEKAMVQLETLHLQVQPFWRLALAAALSSGFFALLFGGGFFEFMAAFICGLAIQTVRRYLAGDYQSNVLFSLLGGMTATLVALALTGIWGRNTLGIIISGAILPLVPGLAMTHAVRDTMRGDLVSGVTKVAEALLASVLIAVGVGLILALRLIELDSLLPVNAVAANPENLPWSFLCCFLGTVFFAGLLHAPLRAIPAAAAIGGAGFLAWQAVSQKEGAAFAAFFAATLLMAIAGEIMARIMKMPATVFITTAIIPIVPGIGLYQTMLLMVEQNPAAAASQGLATLSAIGAMALALAVNSLLMQLVFRRKG